MTSSTTQASWGTPPWEIDFHPPQQPLPAKVDFAVVGGGFTGLAAASWLRHLAPEKTVILIEAGRIGAGASGRTGGMALAESAAGDLPGLGDVLAGVKNIFDKLGEACGGASLADLCEFQLNGAWEIGRSGGRADSPIQWNDSGSLRVVNDVPGGTLNPGKLVSALAEAAVHLGVIVVEGALVSRVLWNGGAELEFGGDSTPTRILAARVLFATNALSLDLAGLASKTNPRLTLAAATEPLREEQIDAIGLAQRKPFYTVDFPYLWGRVCRDNSIVLGAGLVTPGASRDLTEIDIAQNEPAKMFASLEHRVHRLHPALAEVRFTHRWGGPILFRDHWQPVFSRHPQSRDGIVIGAFAGHGVALSSYFGAWAAEALLGHRELPEWGSL